MALKDYLDTAENVGMGALETMGAPFEVVGETIRGAGESEPLKMATAADPSGFRWPSIVQRLAPSTRTPEPPAEMFTKAYQGLEGLANLPRGVQAASDVVTGRPDLAAQLGGMGLGLGVLPPVAGKMASMEFPEVEGLMKPLANESGAIFPKPKAPYLEPGSPERAANFKNWLGESKVVDESGNPTTAYRGDFRGDLINDRFQKNKMSSGRFYFTEDPDVASNYAKGKQYVPDANYENWFEIGTGRSKDNLDNAWYKLSPEQQARVKDAFMRAYKDDETGQVKFGEPDGGIVDPGHWEWALREARGNWLTAGKETWLNSGALYNDEEQFGTILDKAGIPYRFDDPHLGHPTVTPTHLSIKNPIDALNPPEDFVDAVTKWANRSRKKPAEYGEDAWDKSLRDPKEYAKELQEAAKSQNNLWTTSIPDEVIKIAQKLGYDGIQDMGGKYGGKANKQWIAFEPTQIKSAIGNRGTYSPTDPNITHMAPALVGAGAAGAAAGAEGNEQKYAEGGIVQGETDMPFQSQAQRAFMYAKHPKIAERFQEETPKNAKLPEHVKKMNKGGMAGDWKDDLAGYMDQHFGEQSGRTQHLAPGGMAGSTDGRYDVDLGDTSTARGIPSGPGGFGGSLSKDDIFGAPPPLFQPAPAAPGPVQGPVFNPQNGLPPTPAAASVVKPSAPTGPDPLLQGYLQKQRDSLDKYGPEAQAALEQRLQKQRTGFLPNLALAGTGLADAIMQGVARAGSSNYQSNLENRMDKTAEGQRQAFEKGQSGNLAKMKQEMEIDSMDPASVLSKSAQRANMRTLKGLGYSDAEASQIPASMMPEAVTRRLTLEEINQKGELAKATLGMTGAYQNAELAIRRAEANRAAEKEKFEQGEKVKQRQNEAAKEVLSRDKATKLHVLGSDIPVWPSPVSRVERRQAREVQRQGMAPAGSSAQFASEADAEAAGLPVGTIVTINGRPARVR